MNTQALALVESIFFGFGLIFLVAMIVVIIWLLTTYICPGLGIAPACLAKLASPEPRPQPHRSAAGCLAAGPADVRRARVVTTTPSVKGTSGVMASIRHEIVIDASPEHVWDVLRDVGAVHQRLLPGRVADSRVEDGQRLLTFPDGHVIRELIVAVDDATRRLAYSVIEGARPPADYHHASFEVIPEGRRASRLIWTTDVLPHALAARIRIIMERGAMEMKEAIEAAAPSAYNRDTRPRELAIPDAVDAG
jgi:uncharacterized protein YndB with AHSA1/START domain